MRARLDLGARDRVRAVGGDAPPVRRRVGAPVPPPTGVVTVLRAQMARGGRGQLVRQPGRPERAAFHHERGVEGRARRRPAVGGNLCVAPEQVKRVYQTSGTSGAPSVLGLTRGDMETWTVMGTRTYYATGIHEHSSVLTTFGAGPFVAGHTHFVLLRIGTRSVPVAPGDTERVVFGLRAGLADTLLSTASFAQYLANRVEKDTVPLPFRGEGQGEGRGLTHVV